jgi:hypothetical protein
MYSKGTGKAFNGAAKTNRKNPARVGTGQPIQSVGTHLKVSVPVARKPARNKARVA